ncbi:MAG: hypothetical protein HON23_01620 [Rickettsiales bacterium]|jgi:16S rRNA (guanine966-N2)-methyltransferase|nr:hypothetical protein [Rickettsiales bacterium]
MRIISGSLRGRKLESIQHAELRPTTNKIRQKLFNILEHNEDILARDNLSEVNTILDVCSGLGTIAFEALSRGVQNAVLIDKNRLFGELATFNAETLGVGDRVKFCNLNALNLPMSQIKADLCFIDPPYHENIIEKILIALHNRSWLDTDAVVIVEAAKRSVFEIPEQYKMLDKREDGLTKLIFLKYIVETQNIAPPAETQNT